jgi:hypothetical protein
LQLRGKNYSLSVCKFLQPNSAAVYKALMLIMTDHIHADTKPWSYGKRLQLWWGDEQLRCSEEKWIVEFVGGTSESN